MKPPLSIWIGFDSREADAFAVARHSILRHMTPRIIPVYGLILADLIKAGLYRRPIEYRPSACDKPVMWDVLSDAPMSTQHANARFLVPHLAKSGWALFLDGDTLTTGNWSRVFEKLDPAKAVYCVQHKHEPTAATKMDGQVQTAYRRKNWTSVIVFNCDHPANKQSLTLDLINTAPGRDLHALCWLADCDIGELDPSWNFLVGHTDPAINPNVCHFTDGTPSMPGYEDCEFADVWREELHDWARGMLSLPG